MDLETLRGICFKQKATTEDIKWENHLCFNVGGKMYLVTNPDAVPISASIKVNDSNFDALTQREGIIPAPYLARYKWIYLDDIGRLSVQEWETLISEAYQLIFDKLPSKIKREILS